VATIFALQFAGNQMTALVIEFAGVAAIMYFLFILPQKKERQKHQELLASLKPGDQVVTAGGLVGQIVSIKDGVIMMKTGDARVEVERARISRRGTPPAEA
jgi:preprotein translocase subunit YajC